MIVQTSLDNQLPPWMVSAGAVLILIMLAGVVLTIGRDIYNMRLKWHACTARNCARGSNVPTPTKIPEIPAKTKLKLVRHTGVDLEEITLKGRKNDCTAGDRLEDDDPGREHNGH
jgi:hypothetical protein